MKQQKEYNNNNDNLDHCLTAPFWRHILGLVKAFRIPIEPAGGWPGSQRWVGVSRERIGRYLPERHESGVANEESMLPESAFANGVVGFTRLPSSASPSSAETSIVDCAKRAVIQTMNPRANPGKACCGALVAHVSNCAVRSVRRNRRPTPTVTESVPPVLKKVEREILAEEGEPTCFCGSLLWDEVGGVVQCDQCETAMHKKCLERADSKCPFCRNEVGFSTVNTPP